VHARWLLTRVIESAERERESERESARGPFACGEVTRVNPTLRNPRHHRHLARIGIRIADDPRDSTLSPPSAPPLWRATWSRRGIPRALPLSLGADLSLCVCVCVCMYRIKIRISVATFVSRGISEETARDKSRRPFDGPWLRYIAGRTYARCGCWTALPFFTASHKCRAAFLAVSISCYLIVR